MKDGETAERGFWPAVAAIALGAFALVVTEFLPVGLLPQLGADTGVSAGVAGLTITAPAVVAAVAAPAMTMLIGRIDRRTVLLALTGLQIISAAASALAPHFGVLLGARLLLGVAIGGFWGVALAAAARLAPANKVHVASSAVIGGISVASVVSVPAGAAIAEHGDWRHAFWIAAVLAAATLALQAVLLPRIEAGQPVIPAHFFGLLRTPRVSLILAAIFLIVAGHYAAYTFITPFLQQTVHLRPGPLSALLLAYGIFTVVGNFGGGAAAGRRLPASVMGTAMTFFLALLAVAVFGGHAIPAISAMLVWALAWGAAPVVTQLWLYHETPHAIEAAQAMNTSVFQLSIGCGSLLGGLVVDTVSVRSSMWLGAAVLACAIITVLIVRSFGRRPTGPAAGRPVATLSPEDLLGTHRN
jgi:predicted MFS family arabinose efflux permease